MLKKLYLKTRYAKSADAALKDIFEKQDEFLKEMQF